MTQPNCYVKFYKISNNGEVMIETNADNADHFLSCASDALEEACLSTEGDVAYTLGWALPAIVEIACKLRGYKAESVVEQKVLFVGSVFPDSAARLIGSSGVRESVMA
jgi:hypothetical protein